MAEQILDFTNIKLQHLITHHIGNKLRSERAQYSEAETKVETASINYLMKYFLNSFKPEEYYSLKEQETNEVFSICTELFSEKKNFIENSSKLASLLYECIQNPKAKAGELNIAFFEEAIIGDEVVDCIGLFFNETLEPFLKFNNFRTKFNISHELGISLKNIDRAALIFNTHSHDGYKILMLDNVSRNPATHFWKYDFLKVKPINNDFNPTNHYLGLAKSFVTEIVNEEIDLSKTEQIELLNRSLDYFKTHESFDKEEFGEEVFQNEDLIESFRNYDDSYQTIRELNYQSNFDISPSAVKKQVKAFKSILKLDKNFHIYIHGNQELIEQGVDEQGRKYYKIYYENES